MKKVDEIYLFLIKHLAEFFSSIPIPVDLHEELNNGESVEQAIYYKQI